MENSILTSNEEIVNKTLGENEAKTFFMNGKSGKDYLEQEAISQFNDAVDREAKRQSEYFTDLDKYSEQVNANAKNIEIMPVGFNILLKPFKENPFQRIVKTDSGIILETGGMKPVFENTDAGEYQEEEQAILVGVVQEVGPDCKYVKAGDVVMYPNGRAIPVPFYRQGLYIINETAVIVTINEGLTERFKKNNK